MLFEVRKVGDRVGDEVAQHRLGPGLGGLAAAHARDPFLITAAALDQPFAEDALHVRVAVVAKGLGEAHHGRGLHLDLGGRRGDRVERDIVRPLEREARDGLQLAREAGEAPADLGLQLVVGASGRGHGQD